MMTSSQFEPFDELIELGYNPPGSDLVISALALEDQWRHELNPTLRAGMIWCSLRKADLTRPHSGPNAEIAIEVIEGMLWNFAMPIVRTHLKSDREVFESLGLRVSLPVAPQQTDDPDFEVALREWNTFVWGAVSAVEAWALSRADDLGDAISDVSTPMESIPELFAWMTARKQVWTVEELQQTPVATAGLERRMTR